MKVIPRSFWTASPPRPLSGGDEFSGLPYFDDPPVGIEFVRPDDETLYVYRNPAQELNRLQKVAVQGTGHSDIDYNYALSQTVEGAYVLRGGITKCIKTDKLRVLLLMGNSEVATDLMKKNQDAFINDSLSNPYPVGTLGLGDQNVHVFDLIEFLAEHGLYQNRNDGTYNLFVENAIQRLQKQLELNITGEYSMWVINALDNINRSFIKTN